MNEYRNKQRKKETKGKKEKKGRKTNNAKARRFSGRKNIN